MRIHKSLFCTFFLLFSILNISAENLDSVIEDPSYEFANTKQFKISKIELSEKETKIHLDWNMPEGSWIKCGKDAFIRNPETGEKLSILSIENEEFDTRITFDASGEHHSVFIFPALKNDVEKIDYNDQFFGLSLHEKKKEKSKDIPSEVQDWIDAALAQVKDEPIEKYESDEFFSKKPAKIIGYIKGYDQRSGFDTGIYYASNVLTREDYPVTIEIKEDGRFEADIPLVHPVKSNFFINGKVVKFYLEPGQTLGLILDWEGFLEANYNYSRAYPKAFIDYQGKLSRINKEVNTIEFTEFNYDEFKSSILNNKLSALTPIALNEKAENEKILQNYFSNTDLLEKSKEILSNEKDLITATRLFNYVMSRKELRTQHPDNDYIKEDEDIDFYTFLQDLNLNKQALLVNSNFSEFINRFEYSDPLRYQFKYNNFVPEISFLDYLKSMDINLSEEEEYLLKSKALKPEEIEEYNKKIKVFFKKYAKESEAHRKKYVTPYIEDHVFIDFMEPWHKKDSVLQNQLHLKNDLIYDITKVRSTKFDIQMMNESKVAYDYLKNQSATIENEFLIKEFNRVIKEKFPNQPKEKQVVDGDPTETTIAINNKIIPLPDGKPKELFYDIANNYKGKILFIDFWATTCGPCVATIKNMKETRKKYKDNPDFEFVFITDEAQSPLKNYESFTKEQELENLHRVDTDTYNRFRQLFKFNGIPRYIVLNKNGDLIDDDFEMHNFDYNLPLILKKYK